MWRLQIKLMFMCNLVFNVYSIASHNTISLSKVILLFFENYLKSHPVTVPYISIDDIRTSAKCTKLSMVHLQIKFPVNNVPSHKFL